MELCLHGFITKWTSFNQPHWPQQSIPLAAFLSIAKVHLLDSTPKLHDDCFCNIEWLVLSSDVLRDVKVANLDILQRSTQMQKGSETQTPTVDSSNDEMYSYVRKMLMDLDLCKMYNVFQWNCICDFTLNLPWEDLRAVLQQSGLKLGVIYEIRHYLEKPKSIPNRHTLSLEKGKDVPGDLVPPSAFAQSQ